MTELDNDHKVKISTILDGKGRDVYSISPESPLKQMADEMLNKKIGSLVVIAKDGSLVGIISERDFLNVVAKHTKDWEDISVSDVMTKEVITANPEDSLEQASLSFQVASIPFAVGSASLVIDSITSCACCN